MNADKTNIYIAMMKLVGMLPYKVFDELYIQGHYEYFKLKKYDIKHINKTIRI